MIKYLLDSVILIDHFNNISQATTFLQENKDVSAISVITRAEVLTGVPLEHRVIITQFLDCFITFNTKDFPINKYDFVVIPYQI